jgi:hypothetical protein
MIHSKETRTRMAACHALGLHYWAGHPLPGRVWAVDDYQQAHVVRIYARQGIAVLQRDGVKPTRERIWPYRLNQHAPTTFDTAQRVPFTVTAETDSLFTVRDSAGVAA